MRLFTLFFAIVLALTACKKTKPEENVKSKQKQAAIIFLGDSLTAGYGLPLNQSYPSIIGQKIEKANLPYSVINAGVSGDTTAAGLARLSWYLKPNLKPKVLVIALGSNDGMRGIAVKEIRQNLVEIIRQTRKYDKQIKILLVALETLPNMGVAYGTSFRKVFKQVARAEKVPLLPFLLEGVAGQKKLNQADGIHPTREGAQRVAENLWQSLRPHL